MGPKAEYHQARSKRRGGCQGDDKMTLFDIRVDVLEHSPDLFVVALDKAARDAKCGAPCTRPVPGPPISVIITERNNLLRHSIPLDGQSTTKGDEISSNGEPYYIAQIRCHAVSRLI